MSNHQILFSMLSAWYTYWCTTCCWCCCGSGFSTISLGIQPSCPVLVRPNHQSVSPLCNISTDWSRWSLMPRPLLPGSKSFNTRYYIVGDMIYWLIKSIEIELATFWLTVVPSLVSWSSIGLLAWTAADLLLVSDGLAVGGFWLVEELWLIVEV